VEVEVEPWGDEDLVRVALRARTVIGAGEDGFVPPTAAGEAVALLEGMRRGIHEPRWIRADGEVHEAQLAALRRRLADAGWCLLAGAAGVQRGAGALVVVAARARHWRGLAVIGLQL
jgi:hypothetical protein